jgi:hypothetical protein
MLQAGYVPNSGRGGAIAQMIQALAGGMMLKKAQDQIAGLSSQQAEAMNKAYTAKHAQEQADLQAAADRSIYQKGGEKKAELAAASSPEQTAADAARLATMSGPEAAAAGAKAAAEAAAKLPGEKELEQMRTASAANVASIGASATKGRGYLVPDGSGNTHLIMPAPGGGVVDAYQTTTPGGGKLTPDAIALNEADTKTLGSFAKRRAASQQLATNLTSFVAAYTGADPKDLQGLSADELAKRVEAVPKSQAIGLINPIGNRGLDTIAGDMAINAAGTKQEAPTEEVLKSEKQLTVSRYKTPQENADIIRNHARDIAEINSLMDQTTKRIQGRSTPGQGRIPGAQPGPVNPAPLATPAGAQVTAGGTPPTKVINGETFVNVNGQWFHQ